MEIICNEIVFCKKGGSGEKKRKFEQRKKITKVVKILILTLTCIKEKNEKTFYIKVSVESEKESSICQCYCKF